MSLAVIHLYVIRLRLEFAKTLMRHVSCHFCTRALLALCEHHTRVGTYFKALKHSLKKEKNADLVLQSVITVITLPISNSHLNYIYV